MTRWLSWLGTVDRLLNTPLRAGKDGMFADWWYRVFGTSAAEPEPAAVLEHLQLEGFEITGQFRGDSAGWFAAEIAFAGGSPPVQVERYLATEDDIRNELNSWAAWF